MIDGLRDATSPPAAGPGTIRFGAYLLDRTRCRVLRGSEVIPLRRKAYAVLDALVARSGAPITADELMRLAWPGIVVSRKTVHNVVSELRTALGDTGAQASVVGARPGFGYVLLAPIAPVATATPEPVPSLDEFRQLGATAATAMQRGRYLEAQTTLRSGLDALATLAQTDDIAHLYVDLAMLLAAAMGGQLGDTLPRLAVFSRAALLARRLDRPFEHLVARLTLASLHLYRAEYHAVLTTCDEIRPDVAPPFEQVRAVLAYFEGLAELLLGRTAAAGASLQAALTAPRLPDVMPLLDFEANVCAALGLAHAVQGDAAASQAAHERAIRAATASGRPMALAVVLPFVAYAAAIVGDYDTAVGVARRVTALAAQTDGAPGPPADLQIFAWGSASCDGLPDARDRLDELVTYLEQTSPDLGRSSHCAHAARALLRHHNPGRVRRLLAVARAHAQRTGEHLHHVELDLLAARAQLLEHGATTAVADALTATQARAAEMGQPFVALEAACVLAGVLRALGRETEAPPLVAHALAHFAGQPDVGHIRTARRLLRDLAAQA